MSYMLVCRKDAIPAWDNGTVCQHAQQGHGASHLTITRSKQIAIEQMDITPKTRKAMPPAMMPMTAWRVRPGVLSRQKVPKVLLQAELTGVELPGAGADAVGPDAGGSVLVVAASEINWAIGSHVLLGREMAACTARACCMHNA